METLEILKGLLAVIDQGQFKVDAQGAHTITLLRQAAAQRIEEMEQDNDGDDPNTAE